MTKDIEYLKERTDEILEQVKATNGTVREHGNRLTGVEQKQKDHFYLHEKINLVKRHLDKMSRTKMALIISSVIAIFGLAIGIIQVAAMIYISNMR